MEHVYFSMQGMSCGGCVKGVTAVLRSLPGVQVKNVAIGSAEVLTDPATTPIDSVMTALAAAGYPARPVEPAPGAGSRPLPVSGGNCGCAGGDHSG